MIDQTTADQVEIDAAIAYEELFVPSLFAPWTGPMADAACLGPGNRVLDVACGTGALTRMVAERVKPGGSVVGLDLNTGMLSVAAKRSPEIQWQQGSADALPFQAGVFDAVVCQFGLMFFPDPQAAIREMLRVLAPGGRLVVAVWDAIEHSPAFAVVDEIYQRHLGDGIQVALREPYVFGNPRRLATLFAGTHPHAVSIETRRVKACFPDALSMVRGDLEGWLPRVQVSLNKVQIAAILAEAEHALGPFITPQGTLECLVSAHIASVTK